MKSELAGRKTETASLLGFFAKNKFTLFVVSVLASILLSQLSPSEGALGFFLVFPVGMLMVVYLKIDFYREERSIPTLYEFLFAICVLAFSFISVSLKAIISSGKSANFGLTNYAIFLAGLLFLFYGYTKIKQTYPVLVFLVSISVLNILFYSENTGLYALAANILAMPEANAVSSILGAIGINSHTATAYSYGEVAGAYLYIVTARGTEFMWIAGGCTGVMGMGTFAALSSALVLNFKTRHWVKPVIIILGTVGAFFVNLLRLLTLALLLYYYGTPTMLWWHKNEYFALGDLYQMVYMGIFWVLAFRYAIHGEEHDKGDLSGKDKELPGKNEKGTGKGKDCSA